MRNTTGAGWSRPGVGPGLSGAPSSSSAVTSIVTPVLSSQRESAAKAWSNPAVISKLPGAKRTHTILCPGKGFECAESPAQVRPAIDLKHLRRYTEILLVDASDQFGAPSQRSVICRWRLTAHELREVIGKGTGEAQSRCFEIPIHVVSSHRWCPDRGSRVGWRSPCSQRSKNGMLADRTKSETLDWRCAREASTSLYVRSVNEAK